MSADNHRDASTTRKLGLHSYAPKSESAANGQLRRMPADATIVLKT